MKESKLIEKFNKLEKQMAAVTNVLRKIIHDLGNVENLAQGTLTTLKTFMGEKEWDKVIKELKDKDIIKDKKEDEVLGIFHEIVYEIKKINLRLKIQSLEDEVSLNLDEKLYSELLSLRNQLKGG